ncbi:MAG: hypothetical protein KBC26_02745 [Candidatus Pacebacteria bacterium]|nr:hypothetical protein [Candidatus Paceibacterota bacterium]
MTHSFRKKIFWIFVALFVLLATAVMFYSKGFRFDIQTLSVTKTGAIEIESTPRAVNIYLNEEPYKNESNLIQKGTLISGVLPARYRLVLKKEGFYDYEKNIDVRENSVVRVLNALLTPTSLTISTSSIRATGTLIADFDPAGRVIIANESTFSHTVFALDGNATPTNINATIASFFKQKIEKVLFYPKETNKFLVKTAKGIYRVDIKTKEATPIATSSIVFFKKSGDNLLVVAHQPKPIQKKGVKATTTPALADTLSVIDLTLNTVGSTIVLPLTTATIKDVSFSNNRLALLFENGDAYIQETAGANMLKIAHDAQRVQFSPDGTKILYQDIDGKTFVRLLEDDIVSLDAQKGSMLRIALIDASRIKDVWWHWDSYHLIIRYPNKITLAEITRTEPNNHSTLTQATGITWYDQSTKALYILSENKLTRASLEW